MSNVTTTDIALMREAIALAAEGDAPFGAVIVKDGLVLARGRNSGKRLKDPTAHGEMIAIRQCLPSMARKSCAARRSIVPASRVRCAWAPSPTAASRG